jgi:hypothetical protein
MVLCPWCRGTKQVAVLAHHDDPRIEKFILIEQGGEELSIRVHGAIISQPCPWCETTGQVSEDKAATYGNHGKGGTR